MEWILDNIGTLVVGLILLTVIYFAARSVRHDLHTGGCSGCHGCGGSCSCSCSRYQNQTMKKEAKFSSEEWKKALTKKRKKLTYKN